VGEARDFWASIGVPVGDRPAMVMVTRLLPMKGVDDAIASLALPGGRTWQLTVVGEDDYSAPGECERLCRLAARLGVAGRVHFCGRVEEAGRRLGAFDAVAVLSKRGRGVAGEGFGIGVLEGMLAGVPVIATEGVAAAESIDGQAGLVVPPGSPEAVAGALSRLAEPALRNDLGATGRRLARAHPDAASCSARLVAALAEAAGRPGAGLASGPPVSVVTTVLNEEAAIVKLLEALRPQLGDDARRNPRSGRSRLAPRSTRPTRVRSRRQHRSGTQPRRGGGSA
jgi:glycosyltransferase involved in cell wall biosynthesis